jgi:dynein heavy chain, axonemal
MARKRAASYERVSSPLRFIFSYWLTGFLNAQGFLTGMRQEVTRQHKKDQWALDDVVTHTEVLSVDLERIKDVPEEGQNIYGLFLEGAKWTKTHGSEGGSGSGRLEESEPKKLFTPMPVIFVTAVTAKERRARALEFGQYGPFDCPVYKYPKRTDRYLVFRMFLRTDVHPSLWKLRGVALLCSTE